MKYSWEINRNGKYFNLNKFNELVGNVEKIIKLSNIDIRDQNAKDPYVLNHNIISFNGNFKTFDHHESFVLKRIPPIKCITQYSECDTGNKPYDEVVAAALLLLKHTFPEQVKLFPPEVNDNWKRGYNLANQIAPLESLEVLL